jgi:HSP20 family protein
MSNVRWQSLGQLWNEFERAHNDMNRFLQHIDTRGPAGLFGVTAAYPPVNVWDDEENIHLEAELPGITRENLEITVADGNQLALQGQREPAETGKTTWHRQERGFGSFRRTLTLPVLVDSDRIEARFERGVLHVKLPKSPKAQPRRIEVKHN